MHIKLEDGYLYELIIEVTRKCNFSCGHCLRGDAQSLDFNPKFLRKLLSNYPIKTIGRIMFTGGEPLLKPDIISQCLDIFREFDIELQYYYIATNGSMFNKETISVLGKLHSQCTCSDDNTSCVEISNSKWHNEDKNYVAFPYDGFYEFLWDEYKDEFSNEEESEDANYYNYDMFLANIPYSSSALNIQITRRPYLDYTTGNILSTGKLAYGEETLEDLEKVVDEGDTLVHLGSSGKIILDYCDASYNLKDRIGIELI